MANDEYQKTIEIRSKYQEQLDQLIHKGAQIKEEIIIEVQRELNKIRRSISIAQKSIKASELKKAENAYLNAEKITDTLRNIPTNRIPSSGHERVRVIHGRGTGAMRIAVRELFDKHPLVLGYQTAELHEGGIGVTVVKLARANK